MENQNYLKLKSLKNHQFIGFDVDHCLVRYRIKPLTRICYEALAKTIVDEKNYPKQLLQLADKEMGIGLNYSLIDVPKGLILKIGKEKQILKAYKGFQEINIEQEYGKEQKIDSFDPISIRRNPELMVLSTYFENCIGILFAKIVNYRMKDENLTEKEYKEIMQDIVYALKQNYAHYNEHKVFKIQEHGTFFKSICENPQRVMYKQDKFKQILMNLKKENKFIFLITNSHFEFVNVTMSYSYGEDWQSLFDLIFVKAQKPSFFTNYNTLMYEYNENNPLLKGKEVACIQSNGGKLFVEGNYYILENYLQKNFGEFQINNRILFFGDNILSDCYYSQQLNQWDSVAIIEELYEQLNINDEYKKEAEDEITNYQDYWGTFLEYNRKEFNNFWLNIAHQELQGGFVRLLDSEDCQSLWNEQ